MSIPAHVASVWTTDRPPFWARQFDDRPTAMQRAYDVVLGLLAPPACFVLDPGVFRGGLLAFGGGGLLEGEALRVYAFAGVAIVALAAWLVRPNLALLVVGPLFVGALAALGLGVLLAPLSVFALAMFVGLLGLTPFFSAFAYLRNAVRALRACRRGAPPLVVSAALCLGMLGAGAVALGGAHLGHTRLEGAIAAVQSDDVEVRSRGMSTLRRWSWFVHGGRFRRAWERGAEPGRGRLERAFRELRGHDIPGAD